LPTWDGRLIVLRPDGSAVVHVVRREGGHPDLGRFTIRPPVASSGAITGVGPDQARFVGRMMGSRILVIHPDGGTLGYDVIPDRDGAIIQSPFAFGGAKIATDDDVLFAVGQELGRRPDDEVESLSMRAIGRGNSSMQGAVRATVARLVNANSGPGPRVGCTAMVEMS